MWDNLENKDEYKRMILAFASLSEMFAQKKTEDETCLLPIINSKYQETVFQKVFNATPQDISNTSYDASLILKDIIYLIGIKTFGYKSGCQKIAQFKSCENIWTDSISKIKNNADNETTKEAVNLLNKDLYTELVKQIATIRNDRIDSDANKITGPLCDKLKKESIYHVLMPSTDKGPIIYVGETNYDKINIEGIKDISCTSKDHPTNVTFSDGNHNYKFTSADCQLYMDFCNNSIKKDEWKVTYANDAYSIFSNIADYVNKKNSNNNPRILESYSWKINVEEASGFNSFYGISCKNGEKVRTKRIKNLILKNNLGKDLIGKLTTFCSLNNSRERYQIREDIMQLANDSPIKNKLESILYRPIQEVYIPIPESKKFHKNHPDFFLNGFGEKLKELDWKCNKDNFPIKKRSFKVVFEPSKTEMECYITQDNGKAIESCDKQSILGNWILRKVFMLKEYEPLTQKRLNEIGINGIRLDKTEDKKIHLSFIWIDEI